MADRGEFLAGLLVGALVGVGAGLLLAPWAGEETRRKLLGEADKIGDRVRDRAQDVGGRLKSRATDVGGRVKEKVRDTVDEQARRIRIAYEQGKDPAERRSKETLRGVDPEQN